MKQNASASDQVVLARATINLPGFPFNTYRYVDLSSPYVQDCVRSGFLVIER